MAMPTDPTGEWMSHRMFVERTIRRENRKLLGLFRWRYFLDRLLTVVAGVLSGPGE